MVLPNVAPNDDTAALGKAIGQMRRQGDWKLPFIKEHAQNPSEGVVLGLMQALWSGHSDRHPGTSSYVLSTQAAAEAAVSLAVTLSRQSLQLGRGPASAMMGTVKDSSRSRSTHE